MRTALLSLILVPAAAFAGGSTGVVGAKLTVTSSAFKDTQTIPPEFSCDGASRVPPFAWSAVPKTTRSIALFIDDPDAPKGTFTLWLVTNLPATTTGIAKGGALPAGAVASKNGKGGDGYTPPCPPQGRHRYVFHVFALDAQIAPPADKDALLTAIAGHIVASGELLGTYQKITTNE